MRDGNFFSQKIHLTILFSAIIILLVNSNTLLAGDKYYPRVIFIGTYFSCIVNSIGNNA